MSLLVVDDVSVAFADAPDRRLTDGVSFSVAAGEAVAIVGESGSGKSLTARAVMGLLPPALRATGTVTIDGVRTDTTDRTTAPLRGPTIAMVLQDPFTMLNPLRRVGDQIADGISGRAGRRARVAERLAEVGLDADVAGRYPHQLSGGMRQRVGLAAALIGDPRILIADEPTTALDATTQRDVMRLIVDLRSRRDLALVLITHDLGVAFSACERAVVMYAGREVEQAPTDRLVERPLHPYTAALMAADPPLEHRVAELGGIPGSVPALRDGGAACSFAPRCRFAIPACSEAVPPFVELEPDRHVACIRAAELDLRPAGDHARADTVAGPAGDPLLVADGIDVTYPGGVRPALQDVSIRVDHHEAVAIVGESGSGKTTLARTVVGLQRPTAGTIVLDGHDVSDWAAVPRARRRALRRTVQMVFQDPYSSLDPRRTVGQTLNEAIRMSAGPPTTAAALLERVHLSAGMAGLRPRSLSGGERQRVAIARALATRPDLIIFDEAVSALDVSVQAQILDLMNELRRDEGMAILLITHNLAVARQTTDRMYVLRSGRVVEHGPTERLLDAPSDPYTQRLIASVPDAAGRWLAGDG